MIETIYIIVMYHSNSPVKESIGPAFLSEKEALDRIEVFKAEDKALGILRFTYRIGVSKLFRSKHV